MARVDLKLVAKEPKVGLIGMETMMTTIGIAIVMGTKHIKI